MSSGRTLAEEVFAGQLAEIREQGLWKDERVISSPQGAVVRIRTAGGEREALNFCANNYLGLSSHPAVVEAAKRTLDRHGYGMSSVRFICGTQDTHKELEAALARFFGFEDAVLYGSCFDANGGLFEVLLTDQDAVISDQLNHASIIDGVRLSKARRYRYASADMEDLERQLQAADSEGARIKLVATDGVFSMDGVLAPLDRICDLAGRYGALVMVDDSHASGFIGPTGRGTPEHHGVMGRVDILTSTLGKALGGAMGGFTLASRSICDLLRQRSRPYLFSNALSPVVVGASLSVLEILETTADLRERLVANTRRFRGGMLEAGFTLRGTEHPIVPVMIGEARLAAEMAAELLDRGIFVVGFSYPVVPRGEARIRVQLSAVHEPEHVEQAIKAFIEVGRRRGIVG